MGKQLMIIVGVLYLYHQMEVLLLLELHLIMEMAVILVMFVSMRILVEVGLR